MKLPYLGRTSRLIVSLFCACLIAFSFEVNVRFSGDGILRWLQLVIGCLSIPGLSRLRTRAELVRSVSIWTTRSSRWRVRLAVPMR
jgi:hypothetical protein